VIQEIARLIDEERHDAEFSLTVEKRLWWWVEKVGLPLAG